MSGNLFGDFAGLTDSSRVRKPPGGDTHDIFGLEIRQKCQANQVCEIVETKKDDKDFKCMPIVNVDSIDECPGQKLSSASESNVSYFDVDKNRQYHQMRHEGHKFPNVSQEHFKESEKDLRNIEHSIPVADGVNYAGVTDKTRIRKPPGGDTNDIFNLESRQKSQAMDRQLNVMNIRSQTGIGSSNIMGQKNSDTTRPTTSQLKGGQLNANQFNQLLLQVDKENVNLLSEADTEKEDTLKQDEEVYSKQPTTKNYLIHNPITGELSEMKVSQGFKLADCSNVTSSPCPVKKPVRVRQPPGGASSHIF